MAVQYGRDDYYGKVSDITDEPIKKVILITGQYDKTEYEVGDTITVVTEPNEATGSFTWYKTKNKEDLFYSNGWLNTSKLERISSGTSKSIELTADLEGYYIATQGSGTGSYSGNINIATSEPVKASSGSSEKTEIDSVTLTGKPEVGETLEVVVKPDGATVDYEWIKVKDGEETPIEGANGNSYEIKPEDEGYEIKVVVTGNGDYTGEKEFTSGTVTNNSTETPSTNPGERIPTSQEHVDYTTIDTDDVYNGYDQGVEVYVSQGQDIAIRLPFKTVLDGTKGHENKADFEVEVRANISGADNIKVVPETEFTMTTVGKKPIDGTVEIAQTVYNIAKDGEEELSRGKVVNGKVSVENLSAGHWEGDFDWEIKVEGLKLDDSEESAGNTEVTP